MTKYMFFMELQNLFDRASLATKKVCKENPLISEMYKCAAIGAHKRAEAFTTGEAEKHVSKIYVSKKNDFLDWVEDREKEASYLN